LGLQQNSFGNIKHHHLMNNMFTRTQINVQYISRYTARATTREKLNNFTQIDREKNMYRSADKSLARKGRKQAITTEDFEFYVSDL
jgi:hypothetical protein